MLPTDGQTDGQSGPITRPAFAKVTQVKIAQKQYQKLNIEIYLSLCRLAFKEGICEPVVWFTKLRVEKHSPISDSLQGCRAFIGKP